MSQENTYSLYNVEKFNKTIDVDIHECILSRYIEVVIDYLNFIIENIKIKNVNYSKFIVIRGLETITNVFNLLLYYTKNIDITYFHCQKSFYYYVEFIGQITDDQNTFLQLSSRDATTYVYKKTIFEINNTYRKNILYTKEISEKFDLINKYIKFYNIILLKIIYNDNFVSIYDKEYVKKIGKICNKINSLKLEKNNFDIFGLFINTIDDKTVSIDKFIEIILLYLKKIQKNINVTNITTILQKTKEHINTEEFETHLQESSDKFVNWVLS